MSDLQDIWDQHSSVLGVLGKFTMVPSVCVVGDKKLVAENASRHPPPCHTAHAQQEADADINEDFREVLRARDQLEPVTIRKFVGCGNNVTWNSRNTLVVT